MTGCRLGPKGLSISLSFTHQIDLTNTVDGKILYYYLNQSNKRIDSNAGQVFLLGCRNVTLANLTMKGQYIPINIWQSKQITMKNLTLAGDYAAVAGWDSEDFRLTNNTINIPSNLSSNGYGCMFYNVLNITMVDHYFGQGLNRAIAFYHPSGYYPDSKVVLYNLTIEKTRYQGIVSDLSNRVSFTIKDCKVNGSRTGILLSKYKQLIVTNTTVTNCTQSGLLFNADLGGSTKQSAVSNNVFKSVRSGINCRDVENLTIENNRANLCTDSGIKISSANNCIVENNTAWKCHIGIYVHAENTVVVNDTIYDCEYGVYLYTDGATIRDLEIWNCSLSGIYVYCWWDPLGSDTITNTTITNSNVGISIIDRVYDLNVTRTLIDGCDRGMYIENAFRCRIRFCTITNSTSWAIEGVQIGSESYIFHNNFIKNNYDSSHGTYNGPQVRDVTDIFYSKNNEGNYWSDYRTRYPNAKPANQRTWDTPYVFESGQNQDPWPLIDFVDYIPPVARAGNDFTVPENTTVRLDGTSSTDNIGITKYRWLILYPGGSKVYNTATIDFTFTKPGLSYATLTVWDAWDNMDNATITITVLDITPPVADAGEDITVDMGQIFYLDGRNSRDNDRIVSYNWTVDPEGLDLHLTGERVQVTIIEPGDYHAYLNVSDAAGHWATDELIIHVLDTERPTANAGPDIEVGMGEDVVLDGSRSTDNVGITSWNWTFEYEEGTISLSGERATFTFEVAGSYVVTLKVFDKRGLWEADEVVVTVLDTERPVARAGEDVEITQHSEVIFRGGASTDNVGITSYLWTFEYGGETINHSGVETRFVFDEAGVYNAVLTVTDAAGNSGTDVVTVTVKDVTPPVAVANVPNKVDQGVPVLLDGSGSHDNDAIGTYSWTFTYDGEPVILNEPAPWYTFDVPGMYELTLTVIDLMGNDASVVATITIRDIEPPSADAGPDRVIVVGSMVKLDGSGSTDNVGIMYYEWTFDYGGVGKVLHGVRPSFQFDDVGTYVITLLAKDSTGNVGTDTVNINVKPFKVTAKLGPFVDGDGVPVGGATVTLLLNGTTYSGKTGSDGWVDIKVPFRDLVPPVNVTVAKDGWKTLNFDLTVDEAGNIEGTIPPMERDEEGPGVSSSLVWAILALAIVAVVAVASLAILKRKPRRE